MPLLYIRTFGCQMNEYDSARMVDVLREPQGYELTDDPAQADLLLLNTCSVREKAQEKVFSQLGGWKQLKKAQAAPADRRRRLRREPGRRRHHASARRTSTSCSARRRCTACRR